MPLGRREINIAKSPVVMRSWSARFDSCAIIRLIEKRNTMYTTKLSAPRQYTHTSPSPTQ